MSDPVEEDLSDVPHAPELLGAPPDLGALLNSIVSMRVDVEQLGEPLWLALRANGDRNVRAVQLVAVLEQLRAIEARLDDFKTRIEAALADATGGKG